MEFVTIDQAYDALRVYLELETPDAQTSELHEFALQMARDDDGKSHAHDLYPAFRNTVKSDPMSVQDAMRVASEFLGEAAGSNVAIARVSDDLRDASVDADPSPIVWDRWQQAVDSL
ncbi:MAG TPA: hypothetical protein VIG51_05370 [Candidatus Baltobacteraceae bacterium]|jgi:hypothetical protein